MNPLSSQSFKCLERFESPAKHSFCYANPLIKSDIPNKKHPYFCCESHEAEFQSEFYSDEETLIFNENFEGLVFLNEPQVIENMKYKNEIAIQCSEGPPVSLQELSKVQISNEGAKVILPKDLEFRLTHDPLVILPSKKETLLPDFEDDGSFQCKFCFKIFLTGQALGGHMSRKHPTKGIN